MLKDTSSSFEDDISMFLDCFPVSSPHQVDAMFALTDGQREMFADDFLGLIHQSNVQILVVVESTSYRVVNSWTHANLHSRTVKQQYTSIQRELLAKTPRRG
jgi:hypothetical protein